MFQVLSTGVTGPPGSNPEVALFSPCLRVTSFFKLAPLNGKNDDLSLALSLLTLILRTTGFVVG